MKFKLYTLLLVPVALASCHKAVTVDLKEGTPSFNVSLAASNTYKVGTDIVFNFSGKTDIISFFSGELYHDYAFKDGRIIDITNPTIAFTSAVTGGTQANQVAILASTDFNGVYNDTLTPPLTNIHAATWTDITSRFTLGTTATFVASGTKSVSDLIVAGKPLYIAFKYTTKPQAVNGAARTWMFQSFVLAGTASVGNLTLNDLTNAGFRIVDGNAATAPTMSTVAATRITMLGNTFTATNDPLTESWAVSRSFNAGKIDAGPDYPVGIKGVANATLTNYTYKYAKAGTYKVYFVAANANAYESKQIVKEIDITIIP